MFLGRDKELGKLKKELEKEGKSAVLIYGRRRIGKTTLISESLKSVSGKIIACVGLVYSVWKPVGFDILFDFAAGKG